MKKLTALLLIIISIACIFSGCGNGMEFKNKEAMHDYVKGVWEYSLYEYFVFDDENIYLLKDSYFNSEFEKAFSNAWSTGGQSAFKALTYEDVIKDIKFEEIAFKYNSDELIYTPEEGKIVIDLTETPGSFLIEEDGLKFRDGDDEDDEFRALTKISDELDLAKLENIKEYFEEEKKDYKFKEESPKEITTPSQSNSSYNLPTTSELLQTFKDSFSASNVKHDSNVISFKISTGETIFGITNNTDKVRTFKVHASGTSVPTLLEEKYHYYPLCHFLTNIKGVTVTAAEITEILTSVQPTSSKNSVSISMSYTAKRDNIEYKLTATQYTVNNYCTLELSATVL